MVELDPLTPKIPGRSRKKVVCITCGAGGVFAAAGPNQVPAWLCQNYPTCDSYVGVHPGTENALGTLANAELRAERVKAHGWIDRIWRGKRTPTRKEVYQLIAQAIGVRHFHVAQCDLPMLVRLRTCRADIERTFGRLEPIPGPTMPDQDAVPTNSEPVQDGQLVSDIDKALVDALFVKGDRRTWPVDQGGKAAATRCVQKGYANSYLDAAGRRWISKAR